MLKDTAVILAATLLLLTILIMPVRIEAEGCFIPAYNASFSNNLNISPSGYFTGSGTHGFSTYGFQGSCLSINVSSGARGYIYSVFNAKGSFKTSFTLKINNGTSFNFTRILFMLTDSSTYEVKLGFVNDSARAKLVAYRGDRRNDGVTFSTGKWYNLTVWLDASSDALTILYNGSQAFPSPIATGVKLFLVKQVNFSLGVVDPPQEVVKTFFDEFSMLLSPIILTDKPVYTSSSSVQVKISGDQFPASPFDLKILHPNGSLLSTEHLTTNTTGGFSRTISLANPSPGTYTMRVNTSGCFTEYHFGVWDAPRVWERKSIILVKAGGLMRSGSATLYLKNSTHVVFSQRLETDSKGEVSKQITVPVDIQLGVLSAFIECDDALDFKNMRVVTDALQVTLVKAVLNVTVVLDATTYERVKPINVTVRVKYKDGSSLPWNGVVRLKLVYGGVEGREIFMDYTHDGYWFKSIKTVPSDPLGSYVVKVEASDQYGNTGSGNRTFTLTAAKLRITLKNQLNETYERSVRLNVSVSVAYPDGTLLPSGSVTLELIKDQYRKGPFNFNKTGLGEWSISWKIQAREETGEWVLRVTAVDGAGNSGDFSWEIRIVPARLSIQLLNPLESTFSRTQKIPVNVVVKYPSKEILTLENVSRDKGAFVDAKLVHNGVAQALAQLRFSAGAWVGNISAPRDAPIGQYVLNVTVKDSFENYGFYTVPVEITRAVLSFEMEDLKESYQAGFETVSLRTVVKYPDSSTLEDGDVTAVVSSGTLTSIISLRYQGGKWVGDYYLPVTNPVGEYRVVINATDPYGNTGVKEAFFKVSNLYLILVVVSFAVVLAVSVSLLWIRRRRPQPPPASEEYDVLA
ncbi:MAG: hypothetical protein FGF51_00955 [Candidatus Brockarchaeota archaeon]|nr:hypothetical protein [Candidatus Brockarchaeota archaeon]